MKRLLAPYRTRPDVAFDVGDPLPTYQRSSVCVVPSIEDGFAYVVLEALACGVPVIVSENAGAKDAVIDGENGYIVPAGDAGAIVERLRYLYDSPASLTRMRRRAREVAERYTFAREGRALHILFRELVQ
jgi:glycosyltransferase involved in cell wall biosynthesis